MVYAVPGNHVVKTYQKLKRTQVLSDEAKSIREFYQKHEISVTIDPLTGEAQLNVDLR